jgi:hypothetical protein
MSEIDRQRIAGVKTLLALGFTWHKGYPVAHVAGREDGHGLEEAVDLTARIDDRGTLRNFFIGPLRRYFRLHASIHSLVVRFTPTSSLRRLSKSGM